MLASVPPPPLDRVYVSPRKYDVTCGKGARSVSHPGNSLLRSRVAAMLETYKTQPRKKMKTKLIEYVIGLFVAEGARFLKLERHCSVTMYNSVKLWYDGGMQAAKERVGSAFRDACKPNRVKCMENLLTCSISTKDDGGDPLQPLLLTEMKMRSGAEACSGATSAPGAIDAAGSVPVVPHFSPTLVFEVSGAIDTARPVPAVAQLSPSHILEVSGAIDAAGFAPVVPHLSNTQILEAIRQRFFLSWDHDERCENVLSSPDLG